MDEHLYEMFAEEKEKQKQQSTCVAWMPIAPCLLAHFVFFFFPTQVDCCGYFFLLLLLLVDCCGYFSFPLVQCHFFLSYFFFNHTNAMMPLSRLQSPEFFLFSLDATLQKFFLSFMPTSQQKLWLLVGTKIELVALHCTQCMHHPRKKQQSNCAARGNFKFPKIWNHGFWSAKNRILCIKLHAIQASSQEKQQSNCAVGGVCSSGCMEWLFL